MAYGYDEQDWDWGYGGGGGGGDDWDPFGAYDAFMGPGGAGSPPFGQYQEEGKSTTDMTAARQQQQAWTLDALESQKAEIKRQQSIDKALESLQENKFEGMGDIRRLMGQARGEADFGAGAGWMEAQNVGGRQRDILDDLSADLDEFSLEPEAAGLEQRADWMEAEAQAETGFLRAQAMAEKSKAEQRIRETEERADKDRAEARVSAKDALAQSKKVQSDYNSQSRQQQMALQRVSQKNFNDRKRFINSDQSKSPEQRADEISRLESQFMDSTNMAVSNLESERYKISAQLGGLITQATQFVSKTASGLAGQIAQEAIANSQVLQQATNSMLDVLKFSGGLSAKARELTAGMYGSAAQLRTEEKKQRLNMKNVIATSRLAVEKSLGDTFQVLAAKWTEQRIGIDMNELRAMQQLRGDTANMTAQIHKERQFGVVRLADMFDSHNKFTAESLATGFDPREAGSALNLAAGYGGRGSIWEMTSMLNAPMPRYYTGYADKAGALEFTGFQGRRS
jgi:hypothetical protein